MKISTAPDEYPEGAIKYIKDHTPRLNKEECLQIEKEMAEERTRMLARAAQRREGRRPVEADSRGLDQHQPGAKLDAGKPRLALVLGNFARALWRIGEVGTYGANKYTANGWLSVPEWEERYGNALWRHLLKEAMGEANDPDTEIEHAAHLAWNALARLEKALREKEERNVSKLSS